MRKVLILFTLLLFASNLIAQIAIFGDTRDDPDTHGKIVAKLVEHKPQIAFHTGDLNRNGKKQSEYDLFHELCKPLTDICDLWPARGNHERDTQLFLDNFPKLEGSSYYSFVSLSIRFIVLDSTLELKPGSVQHKWLQKAITDSLPSLLFLHHPIFSSGMHGDEQGLQLWLPQMLHGTQVKAVFSGHDHDYERSVYDGISYIVTGGGGAPLREERDSNPYKIVFEMCHHYLIANPSADKLSFYAYDLDDRLIDSFSLTGF